jgi:hypothetical protein
MKSEKPYFKILSCLGEALKAGPSIIISLGRKMTDKEKLTNLLTEFGVEFKIENEDDSIEKLKEYQFIECHEGSEKVNGYYGFLTGFVFDKDGKFVEMGAWE